MLGLLLRLLLLDSICYARMTQIQENIRERGFWVGAWLAKSNKIPSA